MTRSRLVRDLALSYSTIIVSDVSRGRGSGARYIRCAVSIRWSRDGFFFCDISFVAGYSCYEVGFCGGL